MKHTVTVFRGDGIGPELVDNVLKILEAAKAPLEYEIYNVGEDEWKRNGALIPDEAYASFERTKVLLKSPITTPVGKGFRSLNVTLRGKYDLYAKVCMSEKKNRSMRTRFTRSRSLPRKHLSASSATPSSTRRRTAERKLPAFTRQTSSRCLTACSSRSSVKLQRITRKLRLMTRSSTTPACSSL